MMDIAKRMFRGDRTIWIIFAVLFSLSIIVVYSASSILTFKTDYWQPIMKHTFILLAGLVVVLIVHSIKPKFFGFFSLMLPFVWILLIATQFIGNTVNHANRYIFGFQPSEIAKLCLITTVAYFIRMKDKDKIISEKWSFYIIWGFSIVTCGLILPDNLSTAVLLYGVIGFMIFIGQFPYKRIIEYFVGAIAVIALLFAFIAILPDFSKKIGLGRGVTWVERIKDYKNQPEITKEGKIPDDIFQEVMAKIAVARGGIINIPGNGKQSDFLPQAYSDFIYAIIIEEFGVVGGVCVLLLYMILFIRAGKIAGRCPKLFPKLLVMGCALMLIIQAFVNMAVSVGLMPITGQPLPLVSKGGTSIISTCIFIGIILSVSRHENPKGVQLEVEFEEEFEEERRLVKENEQFKVQAI